MYGLKGGPVAMIMRVNIDLAVSLVKNETWSLFILGNPILTQLNIKKVPLGPPIGLKRKLDVQSLRDLNTA